MSSSARAVAGVLLLLLTAASPLVTSVSANETVLLSVDPQHAVLAPGESLNLTLTVNNNGSSIRDYNLTVDDASLDDVWDVVPVANAVNNVFPTWSKNTTVVLRLAEGATVANHGSFDLTVTEVGGSGTATVTVQASVAPAYGAALTASNGNNRVAVTAGQTVTLDYLAHNQGSVNDTLLLDAVNEPDLSGWWANQSNSNNGTTGNGTGSEGNGTSGNGTGGGGNGSTGTPTSMTVLMYGNSYTSQNSLHDLVEDQLDDNGFNGTAQANTGGGLRLDQHWSNLNTSGHQWNTSLRGGSWDYVVLQDQSQVPSFPVTESMWQASKNASVSIAQAVADEGADPVLFMTWGRRSGDSMNAFNNNFTTMQDNLLTGYTRYAQNITNAGVDVYIAPVGLAFKTVHDDVVANGTDPTQSGNLFYDLYTSDGSHPSLAGSYLASCVLYATLTGNTCATSNTSVSLSASVKLALEQAADDTVFNQTSGQSYYPWEGQQPAAMGLGSGVPSGWLLQWSDDELANVPAASNRSSTLTVTVPSDAQPDYYGYRLTVASTGGNVSSSTLLVVEVVGEPAIALAFLDQGASFEPGASVNTSVQVSNTGNERLNLTWGVTSTDLTVCNAAMVDASTANLLPGGTADVTIAVDVQETATGSDSCPLTLTASVANGSGTDVLEELNFVIEVDERVNFSLSGPSSVPAFAPSAGATYDVTVFNHGSDTASFVLTVDDHDDLATVLMTASAITVDAGAFGSWTVRTTASTSTVGDRNQTFSTAHAGQTSTLTVAMTVSPVQQGSITGPFDARMTLQPNSTASLALVLNNTGTSALDLLPTVQGLPAGVAVTLSNTSLLLQPGEGVAVQAELNASLTVTPGVHAVTIGYTDGTVLLTYGFTLTVEDRRGVLMTSPQRQLHASPSGASVWTLDVTNTGTAEDLFVLAVNHDGDEDWFGVNLSTTTVSLAPGANRVVTVSFMETTPGAPTAGITYTLSATSAAYPDVMGQRTMLVMPVVADANLTVLKDDVSAQPGDVVFGSIIVTNTGTGEDTFSVSTIGQDCGLDAEVTLAPGLSSSALGWSCTVPNNAAAGAQPITFRAVSQVRSNVFVDFSILYTVEASWPGSTLVAVTFEQGRLTLGMDSSTSTIVTVENFGNAEVTGSLEVYGEDTGLFLFEWLRLADDAPSSAYTLSAGSTATYRLTLVSNTDRAAQAELLVRATSQGPGVTASDASPVLAVDVEGPALPPNGLSLPLGLEVSQESTLGVMGAGWFLAVAFLLVLRRRGPGRDQDDGVDEGVEQRDAVEDEAPTELGFNETRLDDDNKVECPTCEARLGVPRGSEPPFRFTCPKCSSKIRVVE